MSEMGQTVVGLRLSVVTRYDLRCLEGKNDSDCQTRTKTEPMISAMSFMLYAIHYRISRSMNGIYIDRIRHPCRHTPNQTTMQHESSKQTPRNLSKEPLRIDRQRPLIFITNVQPVPRRCIKSSAIELGASIHSVRRQRRHGESRPMLRR